MGYHSEMALWCTRLKHITDLELVVHRGRHPTVALDADPAERIRRSARQAVGTNLRLPAQLETQRQMLPGLKHRQPRPVRRFQVQRTNVAAFLDNTADPQ